jgi:hypothetical protein
MSSMALALGDLITSYSFAMAFSTLHAEVKRLGLGDLARHPLRHLCRCPEEGELRRSGGLVTSCCCRSSSLGDCSSDGGLDHYSCFGSLDGGCPTYRDSFRGGNYLKYGRVAASGSRPRT